MHEASLIRDSKPQQEQEPYLGVAVEMVSRSDSMGPRLSERHLRTQQIKWGLPVFLLVATCVSTFIAGTMSWEPNLLFALGQACWNFFQGEHTIRGVDAVLMLIRQQTLRYADQGGVYMVCVIAILLAHEMGHYVMTRVYKVPATLPFFIPFPFAPMGTMGAVIAMKSQEADRKQIFDIGIAGPIAGLVFAIPIVWYGVAQLDVTAPMAGSYRYDLPLLARWMYSMMHPDGPGITEVYSSQVSAMFMAGWVGLLITGLNMLPVSQLDGGHVTYTLFGRHSRWIARMFVVLAIAYMAYQRILIWLLMLILVFLIGLYHPPTADDRVPLGKTRVALGLLSLLIPVLCFPPRGLIPF